MEPEIKLHRGFRLYGTEIGGFKDAVKSMSKATHNITVSSYDVALAAVISTKRDVFDIAITSNSKESLRDLTNKLWDDIEYRAEHGQITLYRCEADGKFTLQALKASSLAARPGFTDELITELKNGSKMTMVIDGRRCIVSDLAFSTLNRRACLGGDAMSKPCVGRVVECAKAFFFAPKAQQLQFIIREDKDANIVVAAHSAKYCFVPQTTLLDIYDSIVEEFGHVECLQWEVTHEVSQCYVSFPEIAEDFAATYHLPATITPGLHFSTSDSGDGSLTIRGIWDINGSIAGGETVKRNHRGEIDIDEFVAAAKKTIFADFQAVPARLAELLTIDVPDPQATIWNVLKQIELHKSSNLGRPKTLWLHEQLCKELDPNAKYTAYDIAMMIASLPNRIHHIEHYSVLEKLQTLAKKAVFANYTKKTSKDSTPNIILT